ncbi:MAG: rhomboid family intramembrane serine protease [Gemmatimonadales bacterium]|nr:rhomboid family intramembrane serine protease [Gemmatimonadales bacterium]
MSEEQREPYIDTPGLTPWVGKLMVANAVVLLVLQTVLTAPVFVDLLRFEPARAAARPWTILTYMFVHGGLLHFAANMLALFVFGPPIERRMGSRAFIFYYMYCGVGAAALALGLSSMVDLPPFIGASGAVLGVALAFAFAWPDAELTLFPFPARISARTLVLFLGLADLTLALWISDGIAHVAHLGGMLAGYVFFRLQGLAAARRVDRTPKAVARRPVMAPIPVRQGGATSDVRPAMARPEAQPEFTAEEVDRVLDKISASGLDSLTVDERRFLVEASKRKRHPS